MSLIGSIFKNQSPWGTPPGGDGGRGGATKKSNKFFIYKEDGPKILIHSGSHIIHLKQRLKKDYGYILIM